MVEASELHGDVRPVLGAGARPSTSTSSGSSPDADLLREVARAVADVLPPERRCSAAPEGAAMLLVAAVSLETDLPVTVVRKEPKEYGTRAQVEGYVADGRGHDPDGGREHHGSPGPTGRARCSPRRARTCDGSCSRSTGAAPTRLREAGYDGARRSRSLRPAAVTGSARRSARSAAARAAGSALAEAHQAVLHHPRRPPSTSRPDRAEGTRAASRRRCGRRRPRARSSRIGFSFWIVPVGR